MKQYLARYTKWFSRFSYMALGAALVVPIWPLMVICLALAIVFDAATFSLTR